jgi:hypothetical protein
MLTVLATLGATASAAAQGNFLCTFSTAVVGQSSLTTGPGEKPIRRGAPTDHQPLALHGA